ncbi:MAG: LysM peptidoglycan-binding domain-containing protein [Bradymonadaceae bacterium]
MEEAPPYILTAEGGDSDRMEVRLEGPDVPHVDETTHAHGGELEETATRYPSGDTAVQVHGRNWEPVELAGVFEDRKWGQEGHALDMRDQLVELLEAAPIVRLDYQKDRRWGTMDVTFDEKRRDKIGYRIRFRPYWTEPPESQVVMEFAPPANDMAIGAVQQLESLDTDIQAAPPSVPDSLGQKLLEAIGSAMNYYSSALQTLNGIAGYADIARSVAQQIESAIRNAIAQVESVLAELKSRDLLATSQVPGGGGGSGTSADSGGARVLSAATWAAKTEQTARQTRGTLVDMIREFVARRKGRGASTYVVGAGETLQSIAQNELGDWSRWTEIADRNGLENASVEPGDELVLPPG